MELINEIDVKILWPTIKRGEHIVSCGNQTGEGWFLTGEMLELIQQGVTNIVCAQPFACLPNHIVGKGVIKEPRAAAYRDSRHINERSL